VSCENKDLLERLLACQDELAYCKNDVETWTDSLEELSEIEDAFTAKGKKLHGKTILDVGTDCVKPLYIALKYEPTKIVGINEEFPMSFVSDVERNSKLFTQTKIRFYSCSLFDQGTIDRILEEEGMKRFDYVLVSKTLHHLRSGDCIAKKRDPKHRHREDEKCCIYKFEEKKVFDLLFQLGDRVIIYEAFCPQEEDNDKVRGRGGQFTAKEWKDLFKYLLSEKYTVKFTRPQPLSLDKENLSRVDQLLRENDLLCFYVEK